MRHAHRGGRGRHHSPDIDHRDHGDHPGRPFRHRHGGRSGGRLFDYGELRLLLLAMIAERPRHGYELIKAIEEKFGGSYTPSPGVIYPTLSWLDDMGYVALDSEEAGRKRYRIAGEGEAFLVVNRAAADALLARTAPAGGGVPAPVMRAMENLKVALRLRFRQGPIDQATAERMAAAIDAAAQAVERS